MSDEIKIIERPAYEVETFDVGLEVEHRDLVLDLKLKGCGRESHPIVMKRDEAFVVAKMILRALSDDKPLRFRCAGPIPEPTEPPS